MPLDFSIDDESQPLTRRIDRAQFTQQGQVDWVSLSRGTIHFSLGVLSRLSAASVDPYTVTVGHFIGNQFQLSYTGQRNIEAALTQLKAFGGLGNILWFGFGISHVVRSMSVTEQGATLVALCASLAETFQEEEAALILSEMLRLIGEFKISPALSQWKALMDCCAGIFSSTTLPLRIETLMGMSISAYPGAGYNWDCIASPKSLAAALIGVSKVSTGEWNSIKIVGRREAGWIAAISEWLFGLSVSVVDERGDLKHTSSVDHEAQIQVIYGNWWEADGVPGAMKITEKTYYLLDGTDLFKQETDGHSELKAVPLSGRVLWERSLSAAFGIEFKRLMSVSSIFGGMVGDAARMFEAVAKAEAGVPAILLWQNDIYSNESMGKGLVQHIISTFPELSKASTAMYQSSITGSFTDAYERYQARRTLLQSTCNCIRWCSDEPEKDEQANASLDHLGDFSGIDGKALQCLREGKENNGLCLVLIAETVIRLGRLLSLVDIPEPIMPVLRGLQRLYNINVQRRSDLEDNSLPDFLSIFGNIFDTEGDNLVIATPLTDILLLFTGSELQTDHMACARSSRGICVYIDGLRELTDDSQLISRFHVVPGRIEYNDIPHRAVGDATQNSRSLQDVKEGDLLKLTDGKLFNRVKVRVRETLDSLIVGHNVIDRNGSATGVTIGPYLLRYRVAKARGLVHCPHSSQKKSATRQEQLERALSAAGEDRYCIEAPVIGRCAALMKYRCILREGCVDCCRIAALTFNDTEYMTAEFYHPVRVILSSGKHETGE
jgi:hypothetical protein